MSTIIIVGAGFAGLYTAIKCVDSGYSVTILEKNDYIGGKMQTKYYNDYHIEMGPYRIIESHSQMLNLCQRLGVELKEVPFESEFRPSYNNFHSVTPNPESALVTDMYNAATQLNYEDSIDLSPLRLVTRLYGSDAGRLFADTIGYSKDAYDTNVYNILHTGIEQATANKYGYYIPIHGFTDLISKMHNYLVRSTKCQIIHEHVVWIDDNKVAIGQSRHTADVVVLTVPKADLIGITNWTAQELYILDGVNETRYLKIIAKFPYDWFMGLSAISTDGVLNKFIPMQNGVAMVSYSNGIKARHMIKIYKHKKQLAIDIAMKELRQLIPERNIPDPLEVDFYFEGMILHDWKVGVDVVAFKKQLDDIGRRRGIFIVGETYGGGGSWGQSVIETVERMYMVMMETRS